MCQAASLEAAQRLLDRDFAGRLLLSHGLYHSPYPTGSYILCEVDVTGELPAKRRNDVGIEVVVQVILLDEDVGSEAAILSGDTQKFLEDETHVGTEKTINGYFSDIQTEPESIIADKSEVQYRNGSRFIRLEEVDQRASSAGKLLQNLISKLAPTVCIAPVSIDRLMGDIQKFQDEEASRTTSMYEGGVTPPSKAPTSSDGGSTFSSQGSVVDDMKHPNLVNILGAYKGKGVVYLLFPRAPLTLESMLHFSPGALGNDDQIRLLLFEMLAGLAHCHDLAIYHGNLRPWNILITNPTWCWLTGFGTNLLQPQPRHSESSQERSSAGDSAIFDESSIISSRGGIANRADCSGGKTILTIDVNSLDYKGSTLLAETRLSNPKDWRGVFKRWWAGEISNYDYLLLLNKLAGRRWGDRCFHTVMPWVIDFSLKPNAGSSAGWRDLSKSKWRLAKGDEQLDFTYLNAEMPHHVSDECLSELAVCIYKARQLPLLVLRRIVRSVYEPNEYPANMQRLYHWTPDECIPEFYSDPDVFRSIHTGMSDLAVPPWSQSAEDFIHLHRAALESDRVSQHLHYWIDLTFGYKLSGQAAIDAKNVTLLSSGPTVPRCNGRRQLFSMPHPRRREQPISSLITKQVSRIDKKTLAPVTNIVSASKPGVRSNSFKADQKVLEGTASTLDIRRIRSGSGVLEQASNHFRQVAPLEELVESYCFAETARHLSPCYVPLSITPSQAGLWEGISKPTHVHQTQKNLLRAPSLSLLKKDECAYWESSPQYKAHNLVSISSKELHRRADELKDAKNGDESYLENLVCWEALRQQERLSSQAEGGDVFAAACIIAEVYLRRPLFDPVSMAAFEESGTLPETLEQLPPAVLSLIKPALHPDFQQRPSVEMLLKSPFFSTRTRAVYSFLASLQSLPSRYERLQFAATMAQFGAFQNLGCTATEMVAPCCLSLVMPYSSSLDPIALVCLLRELLRALKVHVAKRLMIPVLQQLLQSQDFPAVQLALLQPPFLGEVQKTLGSAAYLEYLQPVMLGNLRRSPDGNLEKATATVLISMCQDLGLPISLNQTLTPIILSFGRDTSVFGMDALVAIGERLGERVVVKHILPAARAVLSLGIQLSSHNKLAPTQSLRPLAMVDAMAVLDRIIVLIPTSTILSDLLQDPNNVFVQMLLQPKLSQSLLQCAAKALLLVCQRVGPEITAALVLPQLKYFFEEVAFAHEHSLVNSAPQGQSPSISVCEDSSPFQQEAGSAPAPSCADTSCSSNVEDAPTGSERVAIVFRFAVGDREVTPVFDHVVVIGADPSKTFQLEVGESTSEQPKSAETLTMKLEAGSELVSDCNPANLLLDGVGWSIPQSQSQKWKKLTNSGHSLESSPDRMKNGDQDASSSNDDPWYWVPANVDNIATPEAFARGGLGVAKDEQPWKLSSAILHSLRVHSGAMRAAAVMEDENTVYTAGGGSRGGSVVRQWKLATSECCMEYVGHQEAVVDLCSLPGNRVASCDGTLHIWSAQTGEQVAVFDESSAATASTAITSLMSSSLEGARLPVRSSIDGSSSISGLTASLTGGHLYTCLHSMDVEEKLVTGTVNGSLRFFDIVEGRRLFMWRCEPGESFMSSYVSAISSSGQRSCNNVGTKYTLPCAWVAVGFSSGQCRLLDYRSGRVVMNWRGHDASITKLDVLDDNYMVSSSGDKSLRLWDLRRGTPTQLQTFRGHSDGVVSFAVRGSDMLSAAGNKIGLSSLSKSPQSGQEKQVIQPQRLYTAYRGSRSFSQLVSISVLPFSRLFLLGTEDGFLKICT